MIWILYLAAVVAAASGVEETDYKEDKEQDPLKYNPHDRVYKYNENDKRQQQILQEFNNPDYYQPTLVLDYRYMKTGGREYVQGPGGQYIILPKGVKSPQKTEFKTYDDLLLHLKNKQFNKGHIHKEDYGWDDYQFNHK
ncbi:uncharacterized protein LOC128670795 [Plodia interpunctella]|uniref:uncharacterized protein LOC128670795 n=1 Tax=Plodia interpunctella TaxID=58824 RepID=UPI002367D875|nr:uncharacterized protein LOC128670795 [Plodia interpunctella]